MKTKFNKKNTIKTILVVLLCVAGLFYYYHQSKPVVDNNKIDESRELDSEKYHFRNDELLSSHYKKHGIEMGFDSKEAYEKAASLVATNKNALHKNEKEDNDDCYYIEETGEFVVVSTDGYIRTYFITSKKYFDKQ